MCPKERVAPFKSNHAAKARADEGAMDMALPREVTISFEPGTKEKPDKDK